MLCIVWGAVSLGLAALAAWALGEGSELDERVHFGVLLFLGVWFPGVPLAAVVAIVDVLMRGVAYGTRVPGASTQRSAAGARRRGR